MSSIPITLSATQAATQSITPSPPAAGGGPSGDALLLESGDYLLLESGDFLLLE